MIISHSKKFIFLRCRKTASASVQQYFANHIDPEIDFAGQMTSLNFPGINDNRRAKNPHVALQTALRERNKEYEITKDTLKDYFVFCFERNPYRKCISHYLYHHKYTEIEPHKWFKDMSFKSYVYHPSKPTDRHMYTEGAKILANHVAKFENMDQEMEFICKKIGVPYTGLPHLHKGKSDIVLDDWYTDEEMKKRVKQLFKWELQTFNYKYE